MSKQEFENYLSLIGKLLQLTRDQRDQIAGELRDHLELRVADLVHEGATNRDAVAQALEEFGDAAVMAKNFQTVLNHKRRRWMMRFATFSTAATFLAAILVMAMWPGDAHFGTPAASLAQEPKTETANWVKQGDFKLSQTTVRNLRTEDILRQDASLDFDAYAMFDVMSRLSKTYKIHFILDESASDDSLPSEELVTFQLSDVSLGKALEFMLKPYNATYLIDEGVVVIISMDDADYAGNMRVRMYDCQDLLDALPDTDLLSSFLSPPRTNGGFGRRQGGGGPFGGGSATAKPASGPAAGAGAESGTTANQAVAGSAASPASQPSAKKSITKEAKLVELICSMVDYEIWERNGTGGMAKAEMFNGVLVVKAPQKVFREIDNLLADLRGHMLKK